jgi:hypothetical protein
MASSPSRRGLAAIVTPRPGVPHQTEAAAARLTHWDVAAIGARLAGSDEMSGATPSRRR